MKNDYQLVGVSKETHPREFAIVECLEPVIEDIVKIERDIDVRWEATKRLLKEERDYTVGQLERAKTLIDALRNDFDNVTKTVGESIAPLQADLRETFASALKEVRSITEEAIATANRQAANVALHIEAREKTSCATLLVAAQRYGA